MIDDIKEGSYIEMKRRAEDREQWRYGCQEPAERQRTYDNDDETT